MMILVVEIMHLYVLQSCKHKIFMRICKYLCAFTSWLHYHD